jgi:hypothetical protein
MADLLMAVGDEIEVMPLVYEYGVDFYSKLFAGREHICFVGQVESAITTADRSVASSVEPILVCVNQTPVPTDEAELWYQTIGCGRWGLPMHAADFISAPLASFRGDGTPMAPAPAPAPAGDDDTNAALLARESARVQSRHSVQLAQTEGDVVKEIVSLSVQSRNPFVDSGVPPLRLSGAVGGPMSPKRDSTSLPAAVAGSPVLSPKRDAASPASASPLLSPKRDLAASSGSPISPKRATGAGAGELQSDYRILIWYRTGNKELLIRAPALRGRFRAAPPARDFLRCVTGALDAMWNGKEQAELRQLDEADDEDFVVPLLDGLRACGVAGAMRDEQLAACLERALKMSHVDECFLFCRAVDRYRALADAAARRAFAATLVREFVCSGARYEVNLPDSMRLAALIDYARACNEPLETLIDGQALLALSQSGALASALEKSRATSAAAAAAAAAADAPLPTLFDVLHGEVFAMLEGVVRSQLLNAGGAEALIGRVREERERRRRELLSRRVSFNLELASDLPELSVQLRNFEASDPQKPYCFSIGLLYSAAGQTTEAQWFGNKKGSPAFERFLAFMAERIELKGWRGYRGDLDVKTNSTGTHSWFSSVDGVDIMFHVSTELPSGEDDLQQLGKKRRIGNDLGVIVFQDGGTFVPPIVSQLLHVYTVVSPLEIGGREFYRVEVSQKAGVEVCSPPFDAPFSLYPATPAFKRLLTYKLVNAQLAAMRSPFLSRKIFEPSKRSLLEELVKRFGTPDRPGLIKRMGSMYSFAGETAFASTSGGAPSPRPPMSPRRNSLRDSLKRVVSRFERAADASSADESENAGATAAVATAAAPATPAAPAAPAATTATPAALETPPKPATLELSTSATRGASKLGLSARAAHDDDDDDDDDDDE